MSNPSKGDPKLKSFKVQDAVKKQVDGPKGKVAPAPAEPVSSAGFPKIEALVEAATPDLGELEARRSQLETLAKASKSQKEKLAYQRAQKAYEKCRALIESLLATKQRMGGANPG
jgi:hypothetical protein